MSPPQPILHRPVDLTLVAEPSLNGFELRFATYARINPVTVEIEVHQGSPAKGRPPVAAGRFDGGALDDNGWVRFHFVPSEPLPKGPVTVRLVSPEANGQCCVAVYPGFEGLSYGRLLEADGSPSLLAKGSIAARSLRPAVTRGGLLPVILRYWVDCYGVYIEGHLFSDRCQVGAMRFGAVGETAADLSLEPLPADRGGLKYRFAGYCDCPAGTALLLTIATEEGEEILPLVLPRRVRPSPRVSDLFQRFVAAMNALPAPTVVEVGSRRGHEASESRRRWFAPHVRYVGVDIHPDDNTDIVGDVHALSTLIEPGTIDGVFSIAVLEHLALPWRVAIEINRVLKPGGLVYHATPQAWPLHELPNDFWRFSEEGLKRLFGPDTGFRIEGAAMDHEVTCYSIYRDPAYLNFPFGDSFGNAQILSAKEREVDPVRLRWDIDETAYYQLSRKYTDKVDLG